MIRIGQSTDIHQLVKGRKLILGGVEIEHEMGLLGHSDADALLHAIAESILGALALGDLGKHFPDTDMTVDKENAKIKLYGGFISETKKPLQLSMIMDMEASGQKLEKYMQLFVKDDTMYLNMMDMMKQKTSLKDAMGTASIPNVNFDADTFKMNKEDMKKFLKEASVKGNDLKLSFDVEKLNEETKKETEKNNVTDANVEFKKLDMDVTLNNDFMEKAVITMEMTNTKGETKQEMNGTISLTVKDINKVSSIDFPDFKDYKEGSIE